MAPGDPPVPTPMGGGGRNWSWGWKGVHSSVVVTHWLVREHQSGEVC